MFAKLYAIAAMHGREDDIVVLNFMPGNADINSSNRWFFTNSYHPFRGMSDRAIGEMIATMALPSVPRTGHLFNPNPPEGARLREATSSEMQGSDQAWRERITFLIERLMPVLRDLETAGLQDEPSLYGIRDFVKLRWLLAFAYSEKYDLLSEKARQGVRDYLESLPGFRADRGGTQAQTVIDQHGYVDLLVTKATGYLADVYGHIWGRSVGEVEMQDVVDGRRILFVMPASLSSSSTTKLWWIAFLSSKPHADTRGPGSA
jgi:intracellular multiplication protein IcmO